MCRQSYGSMMVKERIGADWHVMVPRGEVCSLGGRAGIVGRGRGVAAEIDVMNDINEVAKSAIAWVVYIERIPCVSQAVGSFSCRRFEALAIREWNKCKIKYKR